MKIDDFVDAYIDSFEKIFILHLIVTIFWVDHYYVCFSGACNMLQEY